MALGLNPAKMFEYIVLKTVLKVLANLKRFVKLKEFIHEVSDCYKRLLRFVIPPQLCSLSSANSRFNIVICNTINKNPFKKKIKHKSVKTNDKSRRLGVVMIPLSRKI